MNTFLPPTSSSKRDITFGNSVSIFDDRIHVRGFVKESKAIAIRKDTDLIEARLDFGSACCKAMGAILLAATTKMLPLIRAQRWDEDDAAGLILMSFDLLAPTDATQLSEYRVCSPMQQ